MEIGSWGDLVFEVSGNKAKSFSELTQKSVGRWTEHETINTAPLSEFLGPGLDEAELTIIFTTMLGVDPQKSYDEVREKVRTGEHFPLVINGVPLSENEWYAKEISASSTVFAPKTGVATWTECTIAFKEYN